MSRFQIFQFPYNSNNYGVLVHDADSGETACVDAGDFEAYQSALKLKGWALTEIWITHHHADHTAGLIELKKATGAKAIGPKSANPQIAGLDELVGEGSRFQFAGRDVSVLETPGHTLDMINFYIADEAVVFTGDTLFALGCGRLFEGTPAQMWTSLSKLMALPDDTIVYCSHEYTKASADFALSVDPNNAALIARANEVSLLRDAGIPTVPTTIGLERATNPFVRPDDSGIRTLLGMETDDDAAVFAEIRKRKDNF
ncbi:MAG: hydroxyacylglutathione hydrolase [Pseudomonadota bacterium]